MIARTVMVDQRREDVGGDERRNRIELVGRVDHRLAEKGSPVGCRQSRGKEEDDGERQGTQHQQDTFAHHRQATRLVQGQAIKVRNQRSSNERQHGHPPQADKCITNE